MNTKPLGRWDSPEPTIIRTPAPYQDPGNPDDCVHDWFRTEKGFRCRWCSAKMFGGDNE